MVKSHIELISQHDRFQQSTQYSSSQKTVKSMKEQPMNQIFESADSSSKKDTENTLQVKDFESDSELADDENDENGEKEKKSENKSLTHKK